jgi:hypothetical protein
MPKFSIFLVLNDFYGQKSKNGSILGLFIKNYKCALCFFGRIKMIDIDRDDRAKVKVNFCQKCFAKCMRPQ